jgi:hypothetical protein
MAGGDQHTVEVPEGISAAAAALISRRSFITRAGVLSGLAALGRLELLAPEAAFAQTGTTVETLNALVAFVGPGPDPYSVAQGQSSPTPGAMAAGTTQALIDLLDHFVPATPSLDLPASDGVASLLNTFALQVNPVATGGGFASPFARLSFAEKAEVLRRFEEQTEAQKDTPAGELRFVSGILVGAVGFLAFSEAGVFDKRTRRLTGEPVGWKITNFDGVAEGRKELRGYWQNRRRVKTDARFRTRRKKKRRTRRRKSRRR